MRQRGPFSKVSGERAAGVREESVEGKKVISRWPRTTTTTKADK